MGLVRKAVFRHHCVSGDTDSKSKGSDCALENDDQMRGRIGYDYGSNSEIEAFKSKPDPQLGYDRRQTNVDDIEISESEIGVEEMIVQESE
ncbi:unnamed protein product [Agarophyton chilense]